MRPASSPLVLNPAQQLLKRLTDAETKLSDMIVDSEAVLSNVKLQLGEIMPTQ